MLEEKIEALALALAANTAILERVVAGQQAALEKIETPKATRTPRATKETPAAAPEPAAETGKEGAAGTESGACAATTATDGPATATNDDLKAVAVPWLAASTNPEDRKEIGEFLMSIAQLFGSPKLTGPDSTPAR